MKRPFVVSLGLGGHSVEFTETWGARPIGRMADDGLRIVWQDEKEAS